MSLDPIMDEICRSIAGPLPVLTERQKLDTIFAAYSRALNDPKTVIPTYLHAAIEAARK